MWCGEACGRGGVIGDLPATSRSKVSRPVHISTGIGYVRVLCRETVEQSQVDPTSQVINISHQQKSALG
jgi:hypothetical protein